MRLQLLASILLAAAACTPSPAPTPSTANAPSPSQAPPEAAPRSAAPPDAAPASTALLNAPATASIPSAGQAEPASTAIPDAAPEPPAAPPLHDEQGQLLPQTDEKPKADGALFHHRAQQLAQAIIADDPQLARGFFFPLPAYEKVKAIADPARDWQRRLWRLFVRDVHDFHRKLGSDSAGLHFVRLEVPSGGIKWMKPHREGNAIGYFRVKRAKLVLADGEGREQHLQITSMISWRGRWYVVHLHGFK